MLGTGLAAIAAATVGGTAYIRTAGVDAAEWDIDPSEGRTGQGRYLVAEGGDRDPVRLDASPAEVLAALDRIAGETPRTTRIVGEAALGRATYMTRSRLMGFPDFTSVRVAPDGAGSVLTAYARLRYGRDDFGVNRSRVEDWITRLEAELRG